MPMSSRAAVLLVAALWSCASIAQNRVVTYDMAHHTYAGETVRCPATIQATNLNTLRYTYRFGSAVTLSAPSNLWTGLQGLATTKATDSTKKSDSKEGGTITALESHLDPTSDSLQSRALLNQKQKGDPFRAVITAINESLDALNDAKPVLDAYRISIPRFTQPIDNLATATRTLNDLQRKANVATSMVTQSGSALTVFVSHSPEESAQLSAAISTQLLPDSTFEKGIHDSHAQWPTPDSVANVQAALSTNALELSNASQQLPSYSGSELPALQATIKSLTAAQTQLEAAFTQFKKLQTTPSPEQQRQVDKAAINLQDALEKSQADFAQLTQLSAKLQLATSQNAAATTASAALAPDSTNSKAFVAAQDALRGWETQMQFLINNSGSAFQLRAEGNESFAFGSTKKTVLTLTQTEMTPGVTNPSSQTVLTVTVECTSRFSLSAGVVFSTIPNRQFSIASVPVSPGSTTTASTITQTYGSNFHPLPLALINARLWEPRESVALYGSFGIAANLRDQSSGGSTAEYLLGPSIGLFRTLFLTTGIHLGNQASVGNGYSVGSPVPSTLTTVPISTTYKTGFGFGLTFTKP